jgi:RNA polymerase sigma-70 factor, ECF subfamily
MQTDLLTPSKTKSGSAQLNWDRICTAQLPRIYNFLRYQLGSRAVAEDLTSATFEKAWRSRSGFRGNEETAISWLFAIARNTARDYFRGAKNQAALDEIEDTPAPDNVEETAQRNSNFARLYGLLRQLPERERELIALKYGADLNNRQIAVHVKLSESNVGTILHRIVLKLQQEWED